MIAHTRVVKLFLQPWDHCRSLCFTYCLMDILLIV